MLHGKKVRLRGVERADLPLLVSWMNDPATRASIARSSPLSMAEEERWFDALLKSTTDIVFVIDAIAASPREKPKTIGMTGIHKIDWKHRNCSVGIVIGDAGERGKGCGTDAMRALTSHAVNDLGLFRVELEVFPENKPAIASYENVGFVVEGTRRSAMWKDGAFKDLVLMSLLGSDVVRPALAPTMKKAKKS